jgi:hypothetical protein
VTPSGLFWTVHIPTDDLAVSPDGKTATLTVTNLPVFDDLQGGEAATLSFTVQWTATGSAHHFSRGSNDPLSRKFFVGDFFLNTTATGSFSGSEQGFSFQSDPGASSVWAEIGTEKNGSYIS